MNGAVLDLFVIALDGDFDLSDRDDLSRSFDLVRSASTVVVDFEKTRYIDSSVLTCLLELLKKSNSRGARLVLVQISPSLRRIFAASGLDHIFDIRSKLGDALSERVDGSSNARRLTVVAGVR